MCINGSSLGVKGDREGFNCHNWGWGWVEREYLWSHRMMNASPAGGFIEIPYLCNFPSDFT